jgi:hypothetical protein
MRQLRPGLTDPEHQVGTVTGANDQADGRKKDRA